MRSKNQRAARIIRWIVLGMSTAFFLFLSGFISEHLICPIGGFELFFTRLFGSGFTLAGVLSGLSLLFIAMSIFSIIFRRAYCGYICPMGALQECAERVGHLVLPEKVRTMRMPKKADGILRKVKYLVLLSFIVGAAIVGTHWMIPGDPFIAMMSLFTHGGLASLWSRAPFAVLFFIGILAFAFFMGRGFCKYICPAGAWYALLSKVSPSGIVRDESLCVGCGKCSAVCPMNIDVDKKKRVREMDCIGCQECVNACPMKGALEYKAAGIVVPSALLPIATAAVFSGSVAVAVATTPARGDRPQGAHNHQNGQDPRANGLRSGTSGSDTRSKVSFGGCSDCSGCGICGILSDSNVAG